MLKVFYEDQDVIVVKKPVGTESQAVHSFAPDMVSEIKKHIHRLSTENGERLVEDYVGVIHRLDKPVGGIMVYAKNKKAAAALSKQVQEHKLQKTYRAVVCGKPVDNVGNFVDYLLKDEKANVSKIVDNWGEKSGTGLPGGGYGRKRRTGAVIGRDPSKDRTPSSDPGAVCRTRLSTVGRCQIRDSGAKTECGTFLLWAGI